MSRLLTWLLTAPILVVGLFAGHELGYRLALPDGRQRAHTLDETGHAYFAYAPYLAASLAAIAVLALGLRVRAAISGRPGAAQSRAFALLPPIGFVLLEAGERLRQGELALATLTAREILLGLALQVPFAVAALLVTRALAAIADAVGVALGPLPPLSLRPLLSSPIPAEAAVPRIRVVALAYGERGPPFS